ncbi:MAG: hypothetical protein L0229_04645 [Blastocatellia bacterium]|nr:hypothetical protein [Blastocatellia bacterium]
MTNYIQETDSKVVPALSFFINQPVNETFGGYMTEALAATSISRLFQPVNETFGGYMYVKYSSLSRRADILRSAMELTQELADQGMAKESRKLLSAIDTTLYILRQFRIELSYIPQLRASTADDGSVLFEWIFNDYRIGFNIETNPVESSWYLITNSTWGEISASGLMQGIDLNKLILWLLNFITLTFLKDEFSR